MPTESNLSTQTPTIYDYNIYVKFSVCLYLAYVRSILRKCWMVIRVDTRTVFGLYFSKIDFTVQFFLLTYLSSRFYKLVKNIDLVFGDNYLKGEYGVMGMGMDGSGNIRGGNFTAMRVRFYWLGHLKLFKLITYKITFFVQTRLIFKYSSVCSRLTICPNIQIESILNSIVPFWF